MPKKDISQNQYPLIFIAHLIFNSILLAILNLNLIPGLTLDTDLKLIISALLLARSADCLLAAKIPCTELNHL